MGFAVVILAEGLVRTNRELTKLQETPPHSGQQQRQ